MQNKLKFSTKIQLSIMLVVLSGIFSVSLINYLRVNSFLQDLSKTYIKETLARVYEALHMKNEITQSKLNSDLKLMEMMASLYGDFHVDKNKWIEMDIINQFTKETEHVKIPILKIGDMKVNNNFELVDKIQKIAGGTATIFQVLPGKLLRVSTNVKKLDGSRAIGTYIPSSSPVYKTVMSGEIYRGKAYVVNAWYITAYKPVRDPAGNIVAVIYVGRKILGPELKNFLQQVHINGKGYLYVYDSSGRVLYHPDERQIGNNIKTLPFGNKLLKIQKGFVEYNWKSVAKIAGITYFKPWDWYFAYTINKRDLLFGIDRSLIFSSSMIAIVVVMLSILIGWILVNNLTKILKKISEGCNKIARGEYDFKIDYNVNDTIGKTVSAVHEMAENIKEKIFLLNSYRAAIPLPMFSIDTKRIVQYANDAICKLTGHTKEEVIGKLKGFEMLNYPSLEVCEVCKPVGEIVIPKKQPWEGEVKFHHKNGEERFAIATAFPLLEKGEILEILIILQDITKLKQHQKLVEKQSNKLKSAVRTINEITEFLASTSEKLSSQIEEAAKGAEFQKQNISKTSEAMEQMNTTTLEVAQNVAEAAESTDMAREKAIEGERVVKQSIDSIKEVEKITNQVKENMKYLEEKAENIGSVINVITEIADQTNLLALNAAIEAARAGEYGRGFAVVADEVKKLAEKTMNATKEVENALASIREAVAKNVRDTMNASKAVDRSSELAANSGEALKEIVQLSETNADKVRAIATAAEEQSASSEQITKSIEEINRISTETSEGMQQAAEAVADLAMQAQKLKELVEEIEM
ncbi:methyl-accepting chemotaxis protein [Desulfothermus sp.]